MKHVYLASDPSEVQSSIVCSSFQSAYEKANEIQKETLDKVVIIVVNTQIETVGDLVLSENWNTNIEVQGSGIEESHIGSIIGTNNKGDGFSVGTLENPCIFNQVRVGNITTNSTGRKGNSGHIIIQGHAFRIGNLDTSIVNKNNITGNGGDVSYINTTSNAGYVNDIITTSIGSNTSAGTVNINVKGACTGQIITANKTNGGSVIIFDALVVGLIKCTTKSGTLTTSNIKKSSGIIWLTSHDTKIQSFFEYLKYLLRGIFKIR